MKIIKTHNFTKTSQTSEELEVEKEALEQRLSQLSGAIDQAKVVEEEQVQLQGKKEQLLTSLDAPTPGSGDSLLDFMGGAGDFDEV